MPRSALGLLRSNRDFAALFWAQVVSYTGDWFATVAVLGLLLDLTHSDVAASGVWVAATIPIFLATPLAGPAVDRFDRRRVMVAVSLAQVVAALGFLLVGPSRVWIAFAAQAAISFLGAFFAPASEAALPNLVDRADLPLARAMMSSTWGAMQAVGAALGGAFALAFGRPAAFVANAASFAVSAGLVASVRRGMREVVPHGGPDAALSPSRRIRPVSDTLEALRYARGNRPVLALLLSKAGLGLGGGVVGILAVFATRAYDAGDVGIGVLFAARGLGAVLGPVLVRRVGPKGVERILWACGVSALVYGMAYALLPASPTLALAAVLVTVAHLGGGAQWALSTYGLQVATPDRLRGRIFAADFALVTLTLGASFLGAGLASERVGPGPVTAWLSAVCVAWGGAYLLLTGRPRRGRPAVPT